MAINAPAIDGSDPGAVPGGSTKSTSAGNEVIDIHVDRQGRPETNQGWSGADRKVREKSLGCVPDGAETGSTNVQRGQLSLGEVPPSSVQNVELPTSTLRRFVPSPPERSG